MKAAIIRGRWIIVVTILIALLLDILPLPAGVVWLRPMWSLLVVIYWVMALPYNVNVGLAFIVGLMLDLLSGSVFGEHAFAMVVIAYLVVKLHQRIRVGSFLQQMLVVFLFLLLYQAIIFLIQYIIGQIPHSFLYWSSSIISAILWPWVFIILRDCRRRFLVA
jgi:rod shape-determining protein MreD